MAFQSSHGKNMWVHHSSFPRQNAHFYIFLHVWPPWVLIFTVNKAPASACRRKMPHDPVARDLVYWPCFIQDLYHGFAEAAARGLPVAFHEQHHRTPGGQLLQPASSAITHPLHVYSCHHNQSTAPRQPSQLLHYTWAITTTTNPQHPGNHHNSIIPGQSPPQPIHST